jgi:Pyruvate flavodoxin/ferredoxin oxidoreductase, thiamine diP-bdg
VTLDLDTCDEGHFGYPITPSSEGAELMAKLLPKLDGVFLQAVSEVAAVNLMYGCGAAGLPSLTFTSSPGFSLMLEGLSYMIGAELPGVFVNVMRGGPGLGSMPRRRQERGGARGARRGVAALPCRDLARRDTPGARPQARAAGLERARLRGGRGGSPSLIRRQPCSTCM